MTSDYTLRPPTLLTVAPMTRRFTKISDPLTSPGPRYFAPLLPALHIMYAVERLDKKWGGGRLLQLFPNPFFHGEYLLSW